jgi:hypothetical protein
MIASDIIIAPFWLAVNLLLGSTAWKWGRSLFPQEGTLSTIVHTLVLCWACVVSCAVVLGLVGFLNGYTLLVLVTGVALGARLCLRFIAKKENPVAPPTGDKVDLAWGLLWGGVFAFWAGHVIADGLCVFPSDWDTLMYHLPLVDHWLQAHSLYAPASSFWFSPGNNEVVALWMVAPFTGDFLYALNNLPAAVLLALATLELAKNLDISRGLSHLAALAVVSQFILFRQLVENENDVAVAAAFMAAVAYGLRYERSARTADLSFAAVALGLLAGVKYYALGYAAVAGGMIVLSSLLCRGPWGAMRAAIALGIGVAVFGGYWYARNWWVSGSPIYPQGLTSSRNLMEEIYPDMWRSTFLGNGSPELLPLTIKAVRNMAGPCHLAAFVGIPVTLAWLLASGFRDHRRWFLALALAGAGLVLGSTPFAVETEPGTLNNLRGGYLPVRFGLCFLSLAVLALAVLLDHATRALGTTFLSLLPGTVFAAAAAYQLFATVQQKPPSRTLPDDFLWGANLLLAGICFFEFWYFAPRWRRFLVKASGVVVLAGATLSVGGLSTRWHRGFSQHYDRVFGGKIFQEAEKHEPESLRWCVLDYRAYPFFGSRRQFWVCQPLHLDSYPELRQYVHDRGVTLVSVITSHPPVRGRYRGVLDWLREHPEDFALQDKARQVIVFARK